LSNFKTKHIFGILMILRKFLKQWAPQAPPKRGAEGARNMGRRRRPKFYFLFLLQPPKAAQNGRRRCPKRGAGGAVPSEDERYPAEGGYFAFNKKIVTVFNKAD